MNEITKLFSGGALETCPFVSFKYDNFYMKIKFSSVTRLLSVVQGVGNRKKFFCNSDHFITTRSLNMLYSD